jgi:hypothetical protein
MIHALAGKSAISNLDHGVLRARNKQHRKRRILELEFQTRLDPSHSLWNVDLMTLCVVVKYNHDRNTLYPGWIELRRGKSAIEIATWILTWHFLILIFELKHAIALIPHVNWRYLNLLLTLRAPEPGLPIDEHIVPCVLERPFAQLDFELDVAALLEPLWMHYR